MTNLLLKDFGEKCLKYYNNFKLLKFTCTYSSVYNQSSIKRKFWQGFGSMPNEMFGLRLSFWVRLTTHQLIGKVPTKNDLILNSERRRGDVYSPLGIVVLVRLVTAITIPPTHYPQLGYRCTYLSLLRQQNI